MAEAVLTAAVILAKRLWNLDWSDNENLWIAWGTWAYTFATVALVLVASLQLSGLRTQIKRSQDESDRHMAALEGQIKASEAARHDMHRPFLELAEGRLVLTPNRQSRTIELAVRNRGSGPLLEANLRFWFAEGVDEEPENEYPETIKVLADLIVRRQSGALPDAISVVGYTGARTRTFTIPMQQTSTGFSVWTTPWDFCVALVEGDYRGVGPEPYTFPERTDAMPEVRNARFDKRNPFLSGLRIRQ